MMLLTLLPVIFFLGLFCISVSHSTTDGVYSKIRVGFLESFLFTGLFITVSTELLSLGKLITPSGIRALWIIFDILIIGYCVYRKIGISPVIQLCKYIVSFVWRNPILVVIPIILTISATLAIIYPPNNYDSLTYHMARVEHWINNKSISHYETHIIKQLLFPPLAEWMILHAQLLTGTDKLANFVQTVFFGGCIIQVSLIAKSLGGNSRIQLLSSLFTALLPMAIIQSNTTQNDVVVSFFALAFVYYTIEIMKAQTTRNLVFAGFALGLAMFTKGTAYLYCVIFCGWFFLILLLRYRDPLWKMMKLSLRMSIVLVIAVAINYAHFSRNVFLTGTFLGDTNKWVSNDGHDVKSLAFVAVKNIMNHMPVTPSMKKSVGSFAYNVGVDIDDPKYSYNTIGWMMEGFSYHEDYAQNFLHTILIGIAVIAFFLRKKMYSERPGIWLLYVLSCLAISFLFTVTFKWQPWSNRLETALFIFFCPIVAWAVEKLMPVLQILVILPFLVFAFNSITKSSRHPILPVTESIAKKPHDGFIYHPGMLEVKKFLDTCTSKSFGLYIGEDSPDYPYYKIMAESKLGRRPMIHMFVNNESEMYLNDLMPQTILSAEATRETYTWRGKTYVRTEVLNQGSGPGIFTLQ